MKHADILDCPFCGHSPQDRQDFLHPTGTAWREDNGRRHYIRWDDPRGFHGRCWSLTCLEHEGGCGAEMQGDSEEEVIARWNRRVNTPIPKKAKPSHKKKSAAQPITNATSASPAANDHQDIIEGCPCLRCCKANETAPGTLMGHPIPLEMTRMFVCCLCGNKRCPHSDDHRNACTQSNATGQPGSRFS